MVPGAVPPSLLPPAVPIPFPIFPFHNPTLEFTVPPPPPPLTQPAAEAVVLVLTAVTIALTDGALVLVDTCSRLFPGVVVEPLFVPTVDVCWLAEASSGQSMGSVVPVNPLRLGGGSPLPLVLLLLLLLMMPLGVMEEEVVEEVVVGLLLLLLPAVGW